MKKWKPGKMGEIGLIGWLFIGFFAAIIVFQLVPSLVVLGSLLAGIFGSAKTYREVQGNGKVNH